jgi:hypothetical protein
MNEQFNVWFKNQYGKRPSKKQTIMTRISKQFQNGSGELLLACQLCQAKKELSESMAMGAINEPLKPISNLIKASKIIELFEIKLKELQYT